MMWGFNRREFTDGDKRKRAIKARAGLSVFAVWMAAALLGCGLGGTSKLEKPYSFEERPIVTADSLPDGGDAFGGAAGDGQASGETVPLFAWDLCVISDEASFNGDDVDSEAGVLFSLSDNKVLYSKNAFERLYPASTTKIMTALIAIKYGNLDDVVTVTEDAVITEAGATLADIKPGDVLTMEQLLYGLMLPSGNDAGAAIAVHMCQSIDDFARLMNEEAARLGATGTHFVNPHGLHDENHYTTAYDMYLIFNEALKYPKFREVTGAVTYNAEYKDKDGNNVTKVWEGGNWYLTGKRPTPEGLTVFSGKTGTTQAAGCCLVMASREGDEGGDEYVSIVMKAKSRDNLYENMTNIISKIVN